MSADITYTDASGKKLAIYRVSLPRNPADWTLGHLRKFVRDADELGIASETHVRRDPEADSFRFGYQAESRYDGICLERVVDLDES